MSFYFCSNSYILVRLSVKFPLFKFYFILFFAMLEAWWKLLGQGENLCHSSYLGLCSDKAGPLTHCTTRQLPKYFLLYNLKLQFLFTLLFKGYKMTRFPFTTIFYFLFKLLHLDSFCSSNKNYKFLTFMKFALFSL